MEITGHLEVTAIPHPDAQIRRVGFSLSDPYLEQVWVGLLGPSGIALLRRLPVLWAEREPAVVPAEELARSLGLGTTASPSGRLNRAIKRTVMYRLAEWAEPGQVLGVYTAVPPLGLRCLDRLPEWSRRAHDRLLGSHLDRLAAVQRTFDTSTLTARLDSLERPPRLPNGNGVTAPTR